MTRVWAYFRSWGSVLATSGLWVVVAAVAGVVLLMWIAGTGFLPVGSKPAWQRAANAHPAPVPAGVCPGGPGCPAPAAELRFPVGARDYQATAANGYETPPEGACAEDGPPPWGAPIWKECGIRCMYERLRNGFCGPGCDYYYFRMQEYKPRKFYPGKPCYRVP